MPSDHKTIMLASDTDKTIGKNFEFPVRRYDKIDDDMKEVDLVSNLSIDPI